MDASTSRGGSRVGSIVLVAIAVMTLSVAVSAVAFGAIGDDGTVKLCVKNDKVRAVESTGACKGDEQALVVYTKDGADAAFLSSTGDVDADTLDGMDSTEFVTTNCIGYPHRGIDWHGCDLVQANLSGAGLISSNLSGANLSGANLSGGKLISSNLTGADLTGALLQHADLTGANLSGADLTGADLFNAFLSQVTWSGTTCPDGTNSDDADGDGGTCLYNL